MAEYTNNLHLIKPTQSENYDVDVANTNNEIIDTAIGSKVSKVAGKGLSSNDFTDGYKSKLDALIEEDDEIEALQKRIVDLENNQLTGTESGTSINIDDSADYQVREIQVKGNSVQDGTPTTSTPVQIKSAGGQVNYFDKNTILEQHLIDSSGNITADSNNFVGDYISILNSSKYTISAITNKAKRIGYYNSSKTFISREVISAYNGSLTIPSNAVYCRLSCHNDDLNSLQLEKGQFVSPYVPYYNGFGKISEIICNKNLSDGELELGNYSDSGEKIEKNDIYRNANFVKVKPQTTYTISKNGVTQRYCLYFYNKNKEFISKNTSLTSGTFTTPANTEYINFRCFVSDFNNNFATYKIQIEVGSSVTSYIQQQTQKITIPTQQPMRAIGDVKDTFVKISNTWYERHYIGQVIFSGSNDESWYMTTDGSFKRFSISVNDLENFQSRKANLKSDYFNGNTVGAVGSMYSYDSYVYLYPDSSITSVDSFKSWLSSNNVEVIYVLSVPTDIACTQEQVTALEAIEKARTYKNVTNILSENETPAYIETTYVKDLETVIDNLVS